MSLSIQMHKGHRIDDASLYIKKHLIQIMNSA